MTINDIILVKEHHQDETVCSLMTYGSVLNKIILPASNTKEDAASFVAWIRDTEKPSWETGMPMEIHKDGSKFEAEFCKNKGQLKDFLIKANSDDNMRFNGEISDAMCLDVLASVGLTSFGTEFPTRGYTYEKVKTEFQTGTEIENLNGRSYRIMEKLSDRNYLLMDTDNGNFMVACGLDMYRRSVKGSELNLNMTAYGVEWDHGVYFNTNQPSKIDFAEVRKDYGDEPRVLPDYSESESQEEGIDDVEDKINNPVPYHNKDGKKIGEDLRVGSGEIEIKELNEATKPIKRERSILRKGPRM